MLLKWAVIFTCVLCSSVMNHSLPRCCVSDSHLFAFTKLQCLMCSETDATTIITLYVFKNLLYTCACVGMSLQESMQSRWRQHRRAGCDSVSKETPLTIHSAIFICALCKNMWLWLHGNVSLRSFQLSRKWALVCTGVLKDNGQIGGGSNQNLSFWISSVEEQNVLHDKNRSSLKTFCVFAIHLSHFTACHSAFSLYTHQQTMACMFFCFIIDMALPIQPELRSKIQKLFSLLL